MAAIAFKQQCPSCEHQVPIRDVALVGKKVECPQCKYKFVVQKPAGGVTEDSAAPAAAAIPAAKKPAGKTGALQHVEDDDKSEAAAGAGASRKKLYIGLGLGVVGLLVLAAYYFLFYKPPGTSRKGGPIVPIKKYVPDPIDEPIPEDPSKKPPKVEETPKLIPKVSDLARKAPGPELTNLLPGDTEHVFHGFFKDVFDAVSPFKAAIADDPRALADGYFKPRLGFAIVEIDDFIRADRFSASPWTYTVIHFNELVDEKAVTAAFGLTPMKAIKGHDYFKATKANPWFEQLGRVAVGVPQWLRTLSADEARPLFVRFHNPQTLIFASEAPLQELLKNDLQFPLKSGGAPPVVVEEKTDDEPKKKIEKAIGTSLAELFTNSTWVGSETRAGSGQITTSFGVDSRCTLDGPLGKLTGTFEYADNKIAMNFDKIQYTATVAGLDIKGSAKFNQLFWTFSLRRVKGPEMVVEKVPEFVAPKTAFVPPIYTKSYLTVRPKLKEMLDRLEAKGENSSEKPLYSTATELEPARVPSNLLPADYRGNVVWRGKQVWDLAAMLDERKPRLAMAGSALVQREPRHFQYRSEFECNDEKEARNVLKMADETLAPELARNFERYLQHKIEIPKVDSVTPVDPVPIKDKDGSRWEATQREFAVDVRIDLKFDNAAQGRAQTIAALFAMAARSEVDLVVDPRGRHLLGQAAVTLAQQGNKDRQIAPGSFPPGAFKRPGNSPRGGNTPYNRIGWMSSLLPYLGHGNLYERIDYGNSWRDPTNWLSARTLVPEFLDASYPEASRHVNVPGLGVAPATTHIVGISGIGLDSADFSRDDPAYANKRGVFGYNRSATLAEIQKGHGSANTIIMMQIPHDGLTGVSPWMAGGGSTLRGIPEKNSIAPFVLSKDKTGKQITNNGKRGTYAIMADGSVRFIDASIPDDVLKAMCTVKGPAAKVDLKKSDWAPLIPDPAAPKVVAPPEAQLELAPPPTKVETDKKK